MEKIAIVIATLAFVGQAFAQQPELPSGMDIAGDAGLQALGGAWTMTPNERVQQAFKALEEQQAVMALRKSFNGPFMSVYGDMSQFACTAVGPDGWCVNPFSAMAKE